MSPGLQPLGLSGISARLEIYNYLGICPRISLRIPAFAAYGAFSSESIPQRKLHAMFILIDWLVVESEW